MINQQQPPLGDEREARLILAEDLLCLFERYLDFVAKNKKSIDAGKIMELPRLGDRHFEFKDKMTYVEKQEITIQQGANFYNGPGREEQESADGEINSDCEETSKKPQKTISIKTKFDRIFEGVRAVYSSGIIVNDYEYSAIYKLIDEKKLFDKFSYSEFIDMLKDVGIFKVGELPSASSISKIVIKGAFPDWKVIDKGYNVTKQITKVGKCFNDVYNKD